MGLDLGSALIGVGAIMSCALPIVMMNRNRKIREKQFLQALTDIASGQDCKIDQHEIFGRFAIGIDESKKWVFFSRLAKDQVDEQSIDLQKIQNCKVLNTNRIHKNSDGNQKIIDKLELCFTPIAPNTPAVKLEFYNVDVSPQLDGELHAVEKWSEIINGRLKSKK